jgi:hypothetical protein
VQSAQDVRYLSVSASCHPHFETWSFRCHPQALLDKYYMSAVETPSNLYSCVCDIKETHRHPRPPARPTASCS